MGGGGEEGDEVCGAEDEGVGAGKGGVEGVIFCCEGGGGGGGEGWKGGREMEGQGVGEGEGKGEEGGEDAHCWFDGWVGR